MDDFKFYEVGGKIRDELLGLTNNNLFHLKRKWNKLMIKEPSASES